MSLLHLASQDDTDRLMPLVAAFHAEMGYGTDAAHQVGAVQPLLEGSPHGAIWLVGPRRAPVGYVVISFGWSLQNGGLDGTVAEIYIRPAVRGRGMGFEALNGIAKALGGSGLRALHLEVARGDDRAQRFYARARFSLRAESLFMSRLL